jgi:hypothetical protein
MLDRIVHLPITPLEAWYASVPRGSGGGLGPDDSTFVAVMRFEPTALDQFVRTAHLNEEEPWLPRTDIADWVPSAVRGSLQSDGPRRVHVNGKCYDGRPFLRTSASSATVCVLGDGRFAIFRHPESTP